MRRLGRQRPTAVARLCRCGRTPTKCVSACGGCRRRSTPCRAASRPRRPPLYDVDGERVRMRVAPSFDGTVVSLRLDGREWLRSPYPRRQATTDGTGRTEGVKAVLGPSPDDWSETMWAEHAPW